MQKPVYFDYAATTPVDPSVAQKMMLHLGLDGVFANPASRSHVYGWQAESAVETARRQVAEALGCDPREIVWTSGATESDNLAIKGVASRYQDKGRHVITSTIEHKAVLDSCHWLESQGWSVTWLSPQRNGQISPAAVQAALRPDTVLASLMHANNELGVLNDIAAIGELLRDRGVLFHVDAAQSAGKVPLSLSDLPVDLVSFSAHKLYGPKGIGALYVRRSPDVLLDAQIHGGGHERGMRSGTLPTHQIVGMGEAFALASAGLDAEMARLLDFRARLLQGMLSLDGVSLNGDPSACVPGIVNLSFAGVEGEALMLALRDLALSSGSACASASLSPSYVLRGIGLDESVAHQSLRFSFGRFTSREEIDFAVDTVRHTLAVLRR